MHIKASKKALCTFGVVKYQELFINSKVADSECLGLNSQNKQVLYTLLPNRAFLTPP